MVWPNAHILIIRLKVYLRVVLMNLSIKGTLCEMIENSTNVEKFFVICRLGRGEKYFFIIFNMLYRMRDWPIKNTLRSLLTK